MAGWTMPSLPRRTRTSSGPAVAWGLIDRLAELLRQTPDEMLSTVCYLWLADYRAPSSVWFAQRALLRQSRFEEVIESLPWRASWQRQEAGACDRIAARSETSARVNLYMSGATPRPCRGQDTSFKSSGASDHIKAESCYQQAVLSWLRRRRPGCMEMPHLGYSERRMGSWRPNWQRIHPRLRWMSCTVIARTDTSIFHRCCRRRR